MAELDDPTIEDEEDEPLDDDDDEAPIVPAEPVEQSFDEIVSKQVEVVEDDDEEESLLTLTREERLESLSIRATPKQANEFVCANCHLVKHNSQMADKKRNLCRDCV